MAYARCGSLEVDKTIEEAIERFTASLEPVGPDLARASLVLSFYENRKKSFFGITKSTERVFWEQWTVPVIVNLRPHVPGAVLPSSASAASGSSASSGAGSMGDEGDTSASGSGGGVVSLSAAESLERERRHKQVETAVRNALLSIVKAASASTEHIPPINFHIAAPVTFPYEITVARPGDAGGSWFSRLLMTEAPRLS